ncbi:hypothetical protein Esi_0020_0041 [Ectocarpus siliculosus]|uniref:Uncharacterized protein n=1 Tax=Ectocarpus siliculosus TaxID=2880 RepID=D8LHT7_ECTSI|nr:hypothetical protein Esi_0020_0041 [Ectocarpus siliculosus]|eukprot:CBN74368.1 hypothetical protein Esi_0020_0041 [Ectocarpus siliculosus]
MWFKDSRRRKSHHRESCNLARYPGWSGLSLNAYIAGVKVTDKAPDSSAGAPSVGNVGLSEVQWPEGIKEIHLLLFHEAVEGRWVWNAFHSARSDFPSGLLTARVEALSIVRLLERIFLRPAGDLSWTSF